MKLKITKYHVGHFFLLWFMILLGFWIGLLSIQKKYGITGKTKKHVYPIIPIGAPKLFKDEETFIIGRVIYQNKEYYVFYRSYNEAGYGIEKIPVNETNIIRDLSHPRITWEQEDGFTRRDKFELYIPSYSEIRRMNPLENIFNEGSA